MEITGMEVLPVDPEPKAEEGVLTEELLREQPGVTVGVEAEEEQMPHAVLREEAVVREVEVMPEGEEEAVEQVVRTVFLVEREGPPVQLA